ncbi:hypothetical protein ACFQ9X_11015 [Catenulispora yoronensis]
MTAVEDAERMVKRGLKLLDPRLAMQALAQAVDAGEDLLTVVDVDWATFAPLFTLRRPSPLIEGLPEVAAALARPARSRPGPAPAANWPCNWPGCPPRTRTGC